MQQIKEYFDNNVIKRIYYTAADSNGVVNITKYHICYSIDGDLLYAMQYNNGKAFGLHIEQEKKIYTFKIN